MDAVLKLLHAGVYWVSVSEPHTTTRSRAAYETVWTRNSMVFYRYTR